MRIPLFILLVSAIVVLAGGGKKREKDRPHSSREKRSTRSRHLPSLLDRSLEDWLELSSEELKDCCRDVALEASGSRRALAKHLLDFYANFRVLQSTACANEPTQMVIDTRSADPPTSQSDNADHQSECPATSEVVIPVSVEEFNQRNQGSVCLRDRSSTDRYSQSSQPSHQRSRSGSRTPPVSTTTSTRGFESRTLTMTSGEVSNIINAAVRKALGTDPSPGVSSRNFPGQMDPCTYSRAPYVTNSLYGTTPHPFLPTAQNTNTRINNNVGLRNSAPGARCNYPSESLPAVQPSVLTKITNGEFCNFDNLLPASISVSQELALVPTTGEEGSAISLIPRTKSTKVKTFNDWMKAWSIYIRVMSVSYPAIIGQLLYYQATIVNYAKLYDISHVIDFDRHFRLRLASNSGARWDDHDEEGFHQYLRSFPLPVSCSSAAKTKTLACYLCNSKSHLAPLCPIRQHSATVSTSTTASDSRTMLTPSTTLQASNKTPVQGVSTTDCNFRPPQGICYSFNNRGFCEKEGCTFSHTCWSCKQNHSGVHCPKRFSGKQIGK